MPPAPTRCSVAVFRCDITPPLGHPLLGGLVPAAAAIADPLEAIGYVLHGAGEPVVVCVLDWAGLMNRAHLEWREALAAAAGTRPDRVALHCVHQHATPFVCPEALTLLAGHPELPAPHAPAFVDGCRDRVAAALRAALAHARPITHVAHASARVDRVASNRRVDRDAAGRVGEMRLSACTDPRLIALPEGSVDPELQTVCLYDGPEPVVACHYYAVHPMSSYRDGRVSADFCGLARRRRQREDRGCAHLYFTGCAGNLAAGKYNDGSPAAREALVGRMHAALVAAAARLRPAPLTRIGWQAEALAPPVRASPTDAALTARLADQTRPVAERLLAAFELGWRARAATGLPVPLGALRLNDVTVLHLPGEVFLEFQLAARARTPDRPVAVAAYGDDGWWYVPPAEELDRGGYEPGVAFGGPEAGVRLSAACNRLLDQPHA
jgi:hypothetical protein